MFHHRRFVNHIVVNSDLVESSPLRLWFMAALNCIILTPLWVVWVFEHYLPSKAYATGLDYRGGDATLYGDPLLSFTGPCSADVYEGTKLSHYSIVTIMPCAWPGSVDGRSRSRMQPLGLCPRWLWSTANQCSEGSWLSSTRSCARAPGMRSSGWGSGSGQPGAEAEHLKEGQVAGHLNHRQLGSSCNNRYACRGTCNDLANMWQWWNRAWGPVWLSQSGRLTYYPRCRTA